MTRKTIRLLAESGFVADPRHSWLPVDEPMAVTLNRVYHRWVRQGTIAQRVAVPGWTDAGYKSLRNGSGDERPPSAHAWNWMSYVQSSVRSWVYFSGSKGVGKTALACILGAHWIAVTGRQARIINWSNWLNAQRRVFELDKAKRPIPAELLDVHNQELLHLRFLVLDDIGTSHLMTTPWALDQLWQVLDGRQTKATILIGNTYLSALCDMFRKVVRGKPRQVQDVAEKIIDRLGRGEGGNVSAEIPFIRPDSFRQRRRT